MEDYLATLKSPVFIGTMAIYIFVGIFRYFLKRKFPDLKRWEYNAITLGMVGLCLIGYMIYLSSTTNQPIIDRRGYPEARVEWRSEINRSDDSSTWPFKEPRYMLSCLGARGDYSVYLVKPEDITYNASRPRDFRPQYYGLKGSWYGWLDGESQLLKGRSARDYQKFIDSSVSLCRAAEARKDGKGDR